ncbi:hypothetical protein [Azonexus hydrophilus]|uniref:Uncharacterized protein n=1 Tax=Azonexus hydrophilus TaxID=418702 RepID=A0ABZ2XFT8_9RHOO
MNRHLNIQTSHGTLLGHLALPEHPRSLVLLPRIQPLAVDDPFAGNLFNRGHAVLTMEVISERERHFVDTPQDVSRLARRITDILDLIRRDGDMQELPLAIHASGDVTPAAIRVAALRDTQVSTLSCHGGLVDRAGLQALEMLVAPLLILIDGNDPAALASWQRAHRHVACPCAMHVLQTRENQEERVSGWFVEHARRLPGIPDSLT